MGNAQQRVCFLGVTPVRTPVRQKYVIYIYIYIFLCEIHIPTDQTYNKEFKQDFKYNILYKVFVFWTCHILFRVLEAKQGFIYIYIHMIVYYSQQIETAIFLRIVHIRSKVSEKTFFFIMKLKIMFTPDIYIYMYIYYVSLEIAVYHLLLLKQELP